MSSPSRGFKKSLASDTGYVIGELLGDGAFSTGVHKAHVKVAFKQKLRRRMSNEKIDTASKDKETKSIAIKVCELKHASVLQNEHLLLAQLDHANVVKVIGLPRRIAGRGIMMMELVEGADLFTILNAFFAGKGSVPQLSTIRYITKALLLGLEYLQQQEVVHNDIKPENILIGARSMEAIHASTVIKICDFGLAMKENESYTASGSPDWSSPEKIFRGAEIFSYASDMFSFGFVVYAACTGLMAIKLGKKMTKREYGAKWIEFSERVREAESGFFAEHGKVRDLVLGTTQVKPEQRISASQALQLEFFGNTK
jgi:serine/threonine protein kinase